MNLIIIDILPALKGENSKGNGYAAIFEVPVAGDLYPRPERRGFTDELIKQLVSMALRRESVFGTLAIYK